MRALRDVLQAELIRLCEMKVTEEVHADDLKGEEQLTTKFVRDFICEDGKTIKKSLRRSRLVGPEILCLTVPAVTEVCTCFPIGSQVHLIPPNLACQIINIPFTPSSKLDDIST